MHLFRLRPLLILPLLVAAACAQPAPLTWTVASPFGNDAWSENFAGIAFGNNRFLVAGSYSGISTGARVATSPDLANWTSQQLPPGIPPTALGQDYSFTAAAFGNGQFIVGASGRPLTNTQKIVASSDNGATWTFRDVRLSDVWGLDYINGLWVATGNSNQSGPQSANLTTSVDGITWTPRATGSGDDLNAAAYGNGRYVAVGNNFQAVTSTDGVTWTRNVVVDADAASRDMTIHLRDVIFANGRFVAAAEGGRVYTSTNGLTWTTHIIAPTAIRFRGVAYGGGRYVVVGDTTTASSTDGVTWRVDTTGLRLAHTVAYGNGVFAIGADFGTVYRSGTPVVAGPVITAQPRPAFAVAGGSASFSVTATGAGLTYQWKRNGNPIPGATLPTLVLTGAAVVPGNYSVDISNADGTATSNAAPLTLVSASQAGRLVNLSVRTNAGTGDNTLIVGVGIGGAGTSGDTRVLLRGVGPALTAFGVPGALADPVMAVFSGQTQIESNDDWAGGFDFASVGAFAFPANSRDAAIYADEASAGSYSIQITGKGGTTGVALAEIYDATPASAFTAATPRLINVSARTHVGTGDNILIVGFAVGGSSPVRLLVRAVGPGLAAFGVGGTLTDPKLEIYSGTNKIEENDNWLAADASAFSAVGAFGLTANSRDAAAVVTLQPGTYTAQVSGVGATTGVALVELYQLP